MASKVLDIPLAQISTELYAQRHSLQQDEWETGVASLVMSIVNGGQNTPGKIVFRKEFTDATPETIAEAISSGVPVYDLVYGFRRFAALSKIQEVVSVKKKSPEQQIIADRLAANGIKGTVRFRAELISPRPTESVLWTQIFDENAERVGFTPVEQSEAEAKLKNVLAEEGVISTKENPDPAKKMFGAYRADQTGRAVRTIENLVALGEAASELREAVRSGKIVVGAAYDLARREPEIQTKVVSYASENNLKSLSRNDVTAIIESGKIAETVASPIKPEHQSLIDGADTDSTEDIKDAALEVLKFYANLDTHKKTKGVLAIAVDNGATARALLDKLGVDYKTPEPVAVTVADDAVPAPEYTTDKDGNTTYSDGRREMADGSWFDSNGNPMDPSEVSSDGTTDNE